MITVKYRGRPAVKRRRSRKNTEAGGARFLRLSFYYLKPQQLIAASARLLCEAC